LRNIELHNYIHAHVWCQIDNYFTSFSKKFAAARWRMGVEQNKEKTGNNPAKLGIFPAFEAKIMSWSLFLRQSRLFGGDILDQIDNFIGVAPFIVVPRNHFNKSIVKRDAGVRVKYRGALVTIKIR